MVGILATKLAPSLRTHLAGFDLQSLSRIPASRLARKAIPNIGVIELVDSETFSKKYDVLYVNAFLQRLERERSDLIVARLAAQSAGQRRGLAPYRVVGVRDAAGDAIGAAQFSVLPLNGGAFAIPYLQYIYVRSENRRQDMSDVLHTITLAVAMADGRTMEDRSVPFAIFETEPPGYGDDDE